MCSLRMQESCRLYCRCLDCDSLRRASSCCKEWGSNVEEVFWYILESYKKALREVSGASEHSYAADCVLVFF